MEIKFENFNPKTISTTTGDILKVRSITIDDSHRQVNGKYEIVSIKNNNEPCSSIEPDFVRKNVDRYITNDNAVIVFFKDGTKEVVKCDAQDTFDLTTGVAFCIMKKCFGKNIYSQIAKFIDRQNKATLKAVEEELRQEEAKEIAEKARAHRHERKLRQKAKKEAEYKKLLEEFKK